MVGVTAIILSGTILKWLFAIILTFEILMQKLAMKTGMILQKLEWLASLQLAPILMGTYCGFVFVEK